MEYILSIKEHRIKKGLTQAKLSKMAKVNQSYISQLERNLPHAKSPTLRMIFNIAKALDVCPHILIQYDRQCKNDCMNKCEFSITL